MRILVGVLGGVLVIAMMIEIFVAFLLPRRVKRDPRIVRSVFDYTWRPWRRVARLLPGQAADTMLGIYGPIVVPGVVIGVAAAPLLARHIDGKRLRLIILAIAAVSGLTLLMR